jgi:hypothetical protein
MIRPHLKPPIVWPLITALLALIGVLIPDWVSPGYYYHDDVRHYFMAPIHVIGAELHQGSWPILSLRSAYAGDFLGEGQFGLFNPVTLFLYAVVSRIPNLETGALFYAGSHLIAIALGVYALARRFGAPAHWAALGGVAYATSGMNSYWYASSWWNALTANAWFIWALVFWLSVLRERRRFLVAMLCSAAVLMGGWPHGSVALAITVGILAIRYAAQGKTSTPLLDAAVTGSGAILISLLAIVPLALHVWETDRAHLGTFHDGILSATLDSLIAISWPSHLTALPTFFGRKTEQPHYYLAWFIAPLLVLNAQRLPALWRDKSNDLAILTILGGLFALLSMGPQHIGALRWPFRFVPYFQLFILLAALGVAPDRCPSLKSPRRLVLLWLLGFILCWQQEPAAIDLHLAFALLCLVAGWLAFTRKSLAGCCAILFGTTLLVTAAIHLVWPINTNVSRWPAPQVGSIQADLPVDAGRVLVVQPRARDDPASWQHLPSGNIPLWENRPFINGYSPVEHSRLKRTLCFNIWGWTCNRATEDLLARDAGTGTDMAALLRIEEIRTASGDYTRRMESVGPGSGFRRVTDAPDHTVWSRPIVSLPGTLSWVAPGLEIRVSGKPSDRGEAYLIENADSQPARMIWARIARPGYEITLDGNLIPMEHYEGLLVSARVPAGAKGELVLTHRMPGWPWTPLAALAGALVVMAYGRRVRRSACRSRA